MLFGNKDIQGLKNVDRDRTIHMIREIQYYNYTKAFLCLHFVAYLKEIDKKAP
jgi:hypothetical protein